MTSADKYRARISPFGRGDGRTCFRDKGGNASTATFEFLPVGFLASKKQWMQSCRLSACRVAGYPVCPGIVVRGKQPVYVP